MNNNTFQLMITAADGTVLDTLDIEIGGEEGYNLAKSFARQALSGEIMDMIDRAVAK